MTQKILLLIGTPRSGTTLLNAMVGCHPDIAMLNEDFGHAVFNLVSKSVVGNKLCVPNQIEMVEKGSYFSRQIQKRNLKQRSPQADLSIREYLDKGASIVATIRHPDPVISSIMKRGNRSRDLATYRWVRGMEIISELVQSVPDRILVLAYPFLVSKPEQVMRNVSSFAGVTYSPAMLEGYAHTPIYANTAIDSSKAAELTMPISDEIMQAQPEAVRAYTALLARATEAVEEREG